ncbi:MAG: PulJ/GspJ family protein [Phycisphaerae bacterium]
MTTSVNRNATMARRGFSVIECVIALPIMGIFLFMAAQLFNGCVVMFHYSAAVNQSAAQRQEVIFCLRRDLRNARKTDLHGSRTLACKMLRNGAIDWHIRRDGMVIRTRLQAREHPAAGGRKATMSKGHFAWSHHILYLIYDVHGRPQRIAFISPNNILRGDRP